MIEKSLKIKGLRDFITSTNVENLWKTFAVFHVKHAGREITV